MSLIVQTNQIFASDVEPVKMIHCILCVVNVLIYYKCCPLGLSSVSPTKNANYLFLPSNLADGSIFAENIEKFLCCDLEWEISYEDNAVDLRWQAHLKK
jgi:hypothetical protein